MAGIGLTRVRVSCQAILWVIRYAVKPTARVLDLVTPGELERFLGGRSEVELPRGDQACWLTAAGFDAMAYDQGQLVVIDEDTMGLDDGHPGEIHLLVVNPAILIPEAVWKGRAYKHKEGFTAGKWTMLSGRGGAGRAAV